MDAVIKIGGSILKNKSIKKLCEYLNELSKQFRFVLLPGGGEYADLVRNHYQNFPISDNNAHWMAITCENILGFFLVNNLELGIPVFTLSEIAKAIESSKIPVFLPFQYLYEQDPLPHSWDVTSDSIAAYIAKCLQADKLILVKDVDGIYTQDPKLKSVDKAEFISYINLNTNDLARTHSCTDFYLPTLLRNYNRACYIVNGLFPERLRQILMNQKGIYTLID
ncbi:MAG TPA: hypothetical protein VMV49_09435 [Candidatus Deferrimicrobium sp.]|nr:hypothetical protein [Candidatus Deferrimicrobium sp.]